jgi:hypothetical protein
MKYFYIMMILALCLIVSCALLLYHTFDGDITHNLEQVAAWLIK